MDVKELASGADPWVHWYYQTKKLPLLRAFARLSREGGNGWTCLDVGAGSGFFSETLAREFPSSFREVVQVDPAYGEGEPAPSRGILRRRLDLPGEIDHAFILLMDVLEHLPDDAVLLREIRERCRGPNRFFVTVPAFMGLWSHHDVSLGHYRRYTRKTLVTGLSAAGFEVERAYYLYALIFPLVWIHRRLHGVLQPVRPGEALRSDMGPVHPLLNAALIGVNGAEMRLDRWNRLWGLTCVAEGRVRERPVSSR